MKLTIRVLLGLLLTTLLGPAWQGCGGKAQTVTETGNPSLLDRDRVQLEGGEGEVRVEASAGAVPGGAVVRATNTTTEQQSQTKAASDGSFELVIPGRLEDGFSLEVEADGETDTFELSEPNRRCDDLYGQVTDGLQDAITDEDQACERDSDCEFVATSVSCYHGCVSEHVLSSAAQARVAQRVSDLEALCADFDAANCQGPDAPSCPGSPAREPFCESGKCQAREVNVCESIPEQAGAALQAAMGDLETNCAADDECVLHTAVPSCASDCYSAAASSSETNDWQAAVTNIEQDLCPSFAAAQCPSAQMPCTQSAVVSCNLGTGTCEAGLNCEQRHADLSQELNEQVSAARAGCAEHTDCVAVEPGVPCLTNCGGVVAVHEANVDAFEAAHATLERACELFVEQRCNVEVPLCGAVDPYLVPRCHETACEMGKLSDAECSPLAAEALQPLTAALQEASLGDLSCETNEDCALVTDDTACASSCAEHIVQAARVDELDALRGTVSESACTTLTEAACDVPVSDTCPAIDKFPNGVGCVEGRCAAL